ncbi:hypothetical protein EDD36DRAFT_39587 [Exophiala viscosa]|uniref:Ig-like domain-containing protein n=1 Tax=Exophiala viscosa TaxID=2486360 RepID=A0AAN6E8L7_9EURO|nr:hypothetical protein EDD36DRAFT_39587 [Exophiala viscosa]
MRLRTVGFLFAAFADLGHAGGTGGSDWGTTTAACVPSTTTVYDTQIVETTAWSTQTVIVTTTCWAVSTTTVVQPTTIVETTTKIQPTTIVETTTEIQPTTIVSTTTVISVSVSPTTVVSVSISPTTDIVPTTVVSVSPTTIVSTTTVISVTTIVTPTTVVSVSVSPTTDIVPTTIISVSVSTTTLVSVSISPTTILSPTTVVSPTTLISQVTATSIDTTTDTVISIGLVTCTSRTINPTYTPPTPLPSNYLWGCPPGTICTPPQIDCNWEQNPPASTYVCSPDECKPTPAFPVPDWNTTWPNPTTKSCAWDQPVLGFFHLNPQHFGLDFTIFDIDGQPVCPTTSTIIVPTTATVTVPTTATVTVSGWQDWTSPTTSQPWKMPRRRGTTNPLAEMFWRRQGSVAEAPAQCYRPFDDTQLYAQSVGKVRSVLCPADSVFMQGISECEACDVKYGQTSAGTTNFPELQMWLNYCNDNT